MAEIEVNQLHAVTSLIKRSHLLDGCRIVKAFTHIDSRGAFRKIYPLAADSLTEHLSLAQVNLSHNFLAGTLRGLHYQIDPFLESKVVTCLSGSVLDVVLDLRPKSVTFGKIASYLLTPASGSLVIPPLVAHGFQTLEGDTSLLYLHSNLYAPTHTRSVNPLDPNLGIEWPLPITEISESDRCAPFLSEVSIEQTKL